MSDYLVKMFGSTEIKDQAKPDDITLQVPASQDTKENPYDIVVYHERSLETFHQQLRLISTDRDLFDAYLRARQPLSKEEIRLAVTYSPILVTRAKRPTLQQASKSNSNGYGARISGKAHRLQKKKKNKSTDPVHLSADGSTWSVQSQAPPSTRIFSSSNRPYMYVQTVDKAATWLTSSSSVPVFAGTNFTLSDLDQYTTFTALYDQYKITRLEAWVELNSPANTISNTHLNKLYTSIDYDNSTAPTSIGSIQDFQNCVETSILDGHYRSWVPHVAFATYSGTFVSYANVAAPWIDCNSTAVQHYGLRGAVGSSSSGGDVISLRVRYHVLFRNVV